MSVGVIDALMMMTGHVRSEADREPAAFCMTVSLIETLALMTDKAMAEAEDKQSEGLLPADTECRARS
jgi:hypothetical protein